MITLPSLENIKPHPVTATGGGVFEAGTYRFIVGLIGAEGMAYSHPLRGRRKVLAGQQYTLTACSKESDWIEVADGANIILKIPPIAEIEDSVAIVIFCHKKRERGYRVSDFAYATNGAIKASPPKITSTERFTKQELQTYTPHYVLGSRVATKVKPKNLMTTLLTGANF